MIEVAISFIVSFLSLWVLTRTSLGNLALDKPNERSLHTRVTPRTGGLGLMAGLLAGLIALGQFQVWALYLLSFVIVSLIDDIRGLPVAWRFLLQLMLSLLFVYSHFSDLVWWVLPCLTLALVWMTNLYNFMDGSDGLAGGMAMIGFAMYAIAASFGHDQSLYTVSLITSAASLAFLCFNFHPASIFMGDSGSIPLGFLAGVLGLLGWRHGNWGWWFPIVVFSPFVVDASITLLKRLIQGEKIWQAHRMHYYQRLVQVGWGHRKTACMEYSLMLFVGILAVVLNAVSTVIQVIGLLFLVGLYGVILLAVDKKWESKHQPQAVPLYKKGNL